MSSPNSLAAVEVKRRLLLRRIAGREPLIVGNVYDVMRRCGSPSCHCAAQPAHRQTLLIFTQEGRRRCKFVRRQDADWVKRAWLRYRACKKALREIRTLNQQELALLRVKIQARRVHYR